MGTAFVHSACGEPMPARDLDKVGAAESVKIRTEVLPLPLLIVGPAYAQHGTARIVSSAVATDKCVASPFGIETQRHFRRIALLE